MSFSTRCSTKLVASPWLLLSLTVGALSVAPGCGDSPAPARDLRIQTSFVIEPSVERYECFRKNITEDVFVTRLSTSSAPGVHHQILGITDQSLPEGVAPCDSVGTSIAESWLFVASSSPRMFAMPADVAYHIPAGSQLVLQMHLLNAGDTAMSSTVSVELTGIAEAEVVDLAQLVEAGSLNIDLPPARETTVKGKCTLSEDVKVFGLLPHMHGLGTTFKSWISNAGTDTMLYDDAFLGDNQPFASFEPVAMPKGAAINVECTYFNGSGNRVIYGPSARDEMCYGFTYYYPAITTQGPLCVR